MPTRSGLIGKEWDLDSVGDHRRRFCFEDDPNTALTVFVLHLSGTFTGFIHQHTYNVRVFLYIYIYGIFSWFTGLNLSCQSQLVLYYLFHQMLVIFPLNVPSQSTWENAKIIAMVSDVGDIIFASSRITSVKPRSPVVWNLLPCVMPTRIVSPLQGALNHSESI